MELLPKFVAPQLARIDAQGVRLFTRSGNDWTAKLPHLQREIGKLAVRDTWLDGEIVVLGPGGRASFQRLQNAFHAPFLDGKDQRRLALKERKEKLKRKLRSGATVRFSEDLQGDAKDGCGRSWSPRSPTPSAPTRASCARRPSWGCGKTSRRSRSARRNRNSNW